jgi:PPK2 family polyphosphate:nucleotide phosphotransferase
MLTGIDHADLIATLGANVELGAFDPAYTSDFKSKHAAQETLGADIDRLTALQDVFYADSRFALLIVLQGMDAAGKDGAIRHVMSGVSPQGVDVYGFKQPSKTELSHDYLWRCARVLPERGRIAIFNRSYYEELTVVRVHTAVLAGERLPAEPAENQLWRDRYADINAFEQHLTRNGTIVLKFFLHLSKDEQRKRLLERIDTPEKNWKISAADIHERKFWDAYRTSYEELLTHTNTAGAPWYIIPADHKWFSRAAIADVIVKRLRALGLAYPSLSPAQHADLLAQRKVLVNGHAIVTVPPRALAP